MTAERALEAPSNYLEGLARILSIFALSLATFLIVLDLSIANVSIPYISGDLGVAVDQGTYVITSFSVGNAIALPMTGWLTERIGAVKLIVYSIIGFVIFSTFCGLSVTLPMLVMCRFFQGFVAGPLVPLSQSLLLSSNPPSQKSIVLGIWSAVIVVGPVIGPILGGWITFNYSWPWIFLINIPTGILSALILSLTMQKFETPVKSTPVDKVGFFLLACSASSFQFVLDKGEQFDWLRSNLIVTLSIVFSVGYLYFFLWEYFKSNPLVDLSLLKFKTYTLAIIYLIFMYSSYFGAIVIVPLWLQESMGYNSVWAGLAVAPLGIPPLFFSKIGTWAMQKWGNLVSLGIALFFFSLSSFYTAYFATNVDVWHVMFSRLVMGFGLVFFISSIISLSVEQIPIEKLPSATGFFHFVRTICSGIGTSLFTTMWIRRQSFHHERLGEWITPYSASYEGFKNQLGASGLSDTAVHVATNELVNQQSAMMSINDIFFFMGWVFLILLIALPLGRASKKIDDPIPKF